MKQVVVFTMEGCPHCQEFKKILSENSVEYVNRDIHEHSEEYQMFSKVKNDLVPAFMIVDGDDTSKSGLFSPDQDYQTLEEALNIIKERI
jgi:glutaredoxin